MGRWEYTVLTTDRTNRTDAPFAVRWINGQELPNWQANLELAVLNGYGQAGWELVTIIGGGYNFNYYLKRRLPEVAPAPPPAPAAPAG